MDVIDERIDYICDNCKIEYHDSVVFRFEEMTFCSIDCLINFNDAENKKKLVEESVKSAEESSPVPDAAEIRGDVSKAMDDLLLIHPEISAVSEDTNEDVNQDLPESLCYLGGRPDLGPPTLEIEIPGKPVTKLRPRFARKGKFVRTFDPQSEQKDGVRWFIKSRIGDMEPLTGPLEVEVKFYFKQPFKRPAKMLKYHSKRPDADNLAKWCMDVGNGLLWVDDSQIVKLTASKGYAVEPKTVIEVRKL